jgi:hypothetical protein
MAFETDDFGYTAHPFDVLEKRTHYLWREENRRLVEPSDPPHR